MSLRRRPREAAASETARRVDPDEGTSMVAAAQRIERLDRLERIIQTQSLLVQADLALNPFMQLVIDKLRELTQAHGASVDFVDGEHTVVRRASGVMASRLGLRISN